MRTAEEREIRTALANCIPVKRKLTLESEIETEAEAVPVPGTEKGRVIG
jgi:hypothetical protein